MKTLYSAQATAIGGRNGQAATADGAFRAKLSKPEALGGDGDGVNPEQLFATGYAACFLSALKAAASKAEIDLGDSANVTATVGIGEREDGQGMGLSVSIAVDLPGVSCAAARDLVAQAQLACPYSHIANAGFDVRYSVL
jgi:lipoyl-dependent peroxiredoxin